MNEYLKYLVDQSEVTSKRENQSIKAIRDFVLYFPSIKETYYHGHDIYHFYYSGNSSKWAPIPFPYDGFTIFNPTDLEEKIGKIIYSRWRSFKYVLPPGRYRYGNEQILVHVGNLLAKNFLFKLREIIIDVLNNNIAQDYNRMFDYSLFSKLLCFDFNLFAQNVENFVRRIEIPNYDKAKLDFQLGQKQILVNRLFASKKELKKILLELYIKEWTLYQQAAILVYFLKMFKIQERDCKGKKILSVIKDYSKVSMASLINKDYAEKLIDSYYFSLPVNLVSTAFRSHGDFTYAKKQFKTINFANIDQFNIFDFNRYEKEVKSPVMRIFDFYYSIDLTWSTEYHKGLNSLIKIYEDEDLAFGDNKTWSNLDGRLFEFEVLNFFRSFLGMDGYVTKASGDRGIDLVIERDIAIQCKNQQQNVSSSVMREFVGSCANTRYRSKVFIAASGYTNEAKLVANENKIVLLTTIDIINVIKGHSTKDDFLNKIGRNQSL